MVAVGLTSDRDDIPEEACVPRPREGEENLEATAADRPDLFHGSLEHIFVLLYGYQAHRTAKDFECPQIRNGRFIHAWRGAPRGIARVGHDRALAGDARNVSRKHVG